MDKKGIIAKVKELFTAPVEFQADYKTQDNRIIRCYGEGLTVGDQVKEITAEGEVDLENGEYTLEDGVVLVVVDGAIAEIKEAAAEEVAEEEVTEETVVEETMAEVEAMLVDGTTIKVITVAEDGTIALGDSVMTLDENAEYVQAAAGEYVTTEGMTLVVDEAGLIVEIKEEAMEPIVEETITEEMEGLEMFNSINMLVEELKALREEIKSIKDENETLKTKVETFAKSPSEEPLNKKVDFNKINKEDKLRFFAR